MTELGGSRILVVGASGGLGAEISRSLAARGAQLALSGRRADLLGAVVPGAPVLIADVTEPGYAERLVEDAVVALGGLDGVVYATGAVAFGTVQETPLDIVERLWQVNTRGAIALLHAAISDLSSSAQGGREPFFVTISGVVAETPMAGLAAYSAVKSALHAHMTAAARELRKSGIRLIDARPGHTETELSKHPLHGTAPVFPAGLQPRTVAERIVQAVVDDEKDLPSGAFHGLS